MSKEIHAATQVPDSVARLCAEHQVESVELVFVDTWGFPRGKRLPVSRFLAGKGIAATNAAYSWAADDEVRDTRWVRADSGMPDMIGKPDYSTFRIAGWAEGLGTVMCDMYDTDGAGIPVDGRSMVRQSLEEYGKRGYGVQLATELEFHLFDKDMNPLSDRTECYSLEAYQNYEYVLSDIVDVLQRTGIDVEASNVEYSPGQFEINQVVDEALVTLDNTILFKSIVRHVARRHGLNASFMAKPSDTAGGSGLHMHLSLTDEDGANAFTRGDGAEPLKSDLMQRFVNGLLHHQLDLQAVALPTINSYRRVCDYSYSPTQVAWGIDNRLVGVRCLPDIGPATRLEVRWASADANPYLVAQGYLRAGLQGIDFDLPQVELCTGDPHGSDRWASIAGRLEEAVPRFTQSSFTKKAFGEAFVDMFSDMQNYELELFRTHVSDWETNRYLRKF